MDQNAKFGFLIGYANGCDWVGIKTMIALGKWEAAQTNKSATDAINKEITALFNGTVPNDMSFGELIDAITKLYDEDPVRAPIPIIAMIDVVNLKSKGASRAQVEDAINSFRANWTDSSK